MVGGVSAGLADYFNIDPAIVRLLWVAAAVISGGTLILAYLVLWAVVPEQPVPRLRLRAAPSDAPSATAVEAGETDRPLEAADSADERTVDLVPRAAEPDPWRVDDTESADRGYHNRRNLAAILLIGLGLLFLANNIGVFRWFNWSMYWPLVLIAVGALLLFNRIRH
jgi:phage shock protein PspC (stress-responsive transcriptional regulator)